jgi:sigma-B regulation protein RsbU (phosphoserine phosphatase)
LYSDGLVEARNAAGQPFGYDSLREVLRSHRETPAASLIAVVLGALDHHLAGQPMTDDLTVLVVESLRRP